MVGIGNLTDILLGQFPVDAIDHGAQLAGVDEKGFASPVTESAVFLVPGDEPETNRNLGGVKKLAGHGHHAVHQVGLDDGLADITLTRGI